MILAGHAYNKFRVNKFAILKNQLISASDINEDNVCNQILPYSYTFDDGLNNLLFIDQIFTDLGNIKFRFFISPKLIEKSFSGDIKFVKNKLKTDVVSLLTWDEIGYLLEKGHILGLHGYDHTDLNTYNEGQIEEDHLLSIELLNKRLLYKTNSFAFPFGRLLTQNNLLRNTQIKIAKKFFSRIYLSDNRLPFFGCDGVYNRRHSEFNNFISINLLKGCIQKIKSRKVIL